MSKDLVSAGHLVEDDFSIPDQILSGIAVEFQMALQAGLRGEKSSLGMFPSFLKAPDGQVCGQFLALDFGGTNVRGSLVDLQGAGKHRETNYVTLPLIDQVAGQDLTTERTNAERLFDFVATVAKAALGQGTQRELDPMPLGFTFSFPCRQENLTKAVLLKWVKEIKVAGAVGEDAGRMLCDALQRLGLSKLELKAITNDTVATLLAGAYRDPTVDVASIIGTGHNTCYLELNAPGISGPMIINTEAGNFDRLPMTDWDRLLDAQSKNPGEQRLEKMVSGRYLGELFRLIWQRFWSEGQIPYGPEQFSEPYTVSGRDIAVFLSPRTANVGSSFDSGSNAETNNVGFEKVNREVALWSGRDKAAAEFLRTIAEALIRRSAYLVAATYTGLLTHLDPGLTKQHNIAIDGSLYEKMPGYQANLNTVLQLLLGPKASMVNTKLVKDGSRLGAAVAAAIAMR